MNEREGTPVRRRTPDTEDEQQISMEGSARMHEADAEPGAESEEKTPRRQAARPTGVPGGEATLANTESDGQRGAV